MRAATRTRDTMTYWTRAARPGLRGRRRPTGGGARAPRARRRPRPARQGQRDPERVGGEVRGEQEHGQGEGEGRARELLPARQPEAADEREDGNDCERRRSGRADSWTRRNGVSTPPKSQRGAVTTDSSRAGKCAGSPRISRRSVRDRAGERGVEVLVREVPRGRMRQIGGEPERRRGNRDSSDEHRGGKFGDASQPVGACFDPLDVGCCRGH